MIDNTPRERLAPELYGYKGGNYIVVYDQQIETDKNLVAIYGRDGTEIRFFVKFRYGDVAAGPFSILEDAMNECDRLNGKVKLSFCDRIMRLIGSQRNGRNKRHRI